MKTPLKYFGGKKTVLKPLSLLLPPGYGAYIEPFCGSAALFFHVEPVDHTCILGDASFLTMNYWKQVKENGEKMMKELQSVPYCFESFDEARNHLKEWKNGTFAGSEYQLACWLMIGRCMGFKGAYNKGFGKDAVGIKKGCKVRTWGRETLRLLEASDRLQSVRLFHGDYKEFIQDASVGDFIFCDPPYPGVTQDQYGKSLAFSQSDYIEMIERLQKIGAYFMATCYPETAELFPFLRRHDVILEKRAPAGGGNVGVRTECILRNYD